VQKRGIQERAVFIGKALKKKLRFQRGQSSYTVCKGQKSVPRAGKKKKMPGPAKGKKKRVFG